MHGMLQVQKYLNFRDFRPLALQAREFNQSSDSLIEKK
jgi:hypothetical protein